MKIPINSRTSTILDFNKTWTLRKLMVELNKFLKCIPHRMRHGLLANTYTNHLPFPTKISNLQDWSLLGSGYALRTKIWDVTQFMLQEWSGVELGIRVYTEGSACAHRSLVEELTYVQEDWSLEVIDHCGIAILYESHSVIHGKPSVLNGNYFDVFAHFEPSC